MSTSEVRGPTRVSMARASIKWAVAHTKVRTRDGRRDPRRVAGAFTAMAAPPTSLTAIVDSCSTPIGDGAEFEEESLMKHAFGFGQFIVLMTSAVIWGCSAGGHDPPQSDVGTVQEDLCSAGGLSSNDADN